MRHAILLSVFLWSVCAAPSLAQLTLDNPLDEPQPYVSDSGVLPNFSAAPRVLHVEPIQVPQAAWLRLYFGEETELGEGSFLRIRSELDGEIQQLDAEALEMWGYSTAYFNGSKLTVELIGGPDTQRNRVVTSRLAFSDLPQGTFEGSCGICGPDDRLPTFETYASRLLPAGCSATTYNTNSCVVSAGHCVGGNMVLQFNVPESTPTCALVNPPVDEQFPVVQGLFTNSGVGNDWAVLAVGTNGLGEQPYDRYGTFRPIASTPPEGGEELTVTGYGIDNECTRNQVQQTSSGDVSSVSSSFFSHFVDTTFGNSGSSMLRDGEIVGIATHCGCPNIATRMDESGFVAARESLCPVQELVAASLTDLQVLVGTPTGDLASVLASDDDHLAVDSAAQGIRNTAITKVTGSFPFSSVTELNVSVEIGAVDVSPVFVGVSLFNYDTGIFNTLAFGIASTSGDQTIELTGVPGAGAYVNDSGEVMVRVYHTARLVQTPDGFTKLIDAIEVTARP